VSTWADRELDCPACHAKVKARIALGVHVNRMPQVRDDVLARRFHRFACGCGETIAVDTSFEYTDIERKQLVLVSTNSMRAEWPALERELAAIVHRVRDLGSPLVHWIVEGLRARVVFGVDELREKLLLWQVGLDDALIECIKVRAWTADLTLAAPGSRLLVDEVADDDTLRCRWLGDGGARRVDLPAEWIRDAQRDRESLATRFPELFDGGFVSIAKLRA
jgi:hypothetical protein